MAGEKITMGVTDCSCFGVGGIPPVTITENIQPDDEWALFRLTDVGLECYKMGCEFTAGIMSLYIDGKPAVNELARRKTKEEAKVIWAEFPESKRERILIRAVRPITAKK